MPFTLEHAAQEIQDMIDLCFVDEQESPCPEKISTALHCLREWNPRGRRSLTELFELAMDEKEYKRKNRMSMGKK